MRLPLTLSIAATALALALPASAWAGQPDFDEDDLPPPPSAIAPPEVLPPPHRGYDGPEGPGWDHGGPPRHGDWRAHCGHHGAVQPGCHGYPMPHGYGHGYMGYGVPMMMVPVLRNKPCPERVVEEWVEEPVRVRRRYIAPRRHVIPDKRVRLIPDKRLPMDKRIAY